MFFIAIDKRDALLTSMFSLMKWKHYKRQSACNTYEYNWGSYILTALHKHTATISNTAISASVTLNQVQLRPSALIPSGATASFQSSNGFNESFRLATFPQHSVSPAWLSAVHFVPYVRHYQASADHGPDVSGITPRTITNVKCVC